MRLRIAAALFKLSSATLMLFALQTAHADNWSFLKDTPLAKFTDEDRQIMMSNAGVVVNDDSSSAARGWKNANTGHSGTAQILASFSGPDNIPCKRLRISNRAGSNQNKANYSVCKFADEGWKLVSNEFAPYQKKVEKK